MVAWKHNYTLVYALIDQRACGEHGLPNYVVYSSQSENGLVAPLGTIYSLVTPLGTIYSLIGDSPTVDNVLVARLLTVGPTACAFRTVAARPPYIFFRGTVSFLWRNSFFSTTRWAGSTNFDQGSRGPDTKDLVCPPFPGRSRASDHIQFGLANLGQKTLIFTADNVQHGNKGAQKI